MGKIATSVEAWNKALVRDRFEAWVLGTVPLSSCSPMTQAGRLRATRSRRKWRSGSEDNEEAARKK
jgi:hypothetical protein